MNDPFAEFATVFLGDPPAAEPQQGPPQTEQPPPNPDSQDAAASPLFIENLNTVKPRSCDRQDPLTELYRGSNERELIDNTLPLAFAVILGRVGEPTSPFGSLPKDQDSICLAAIDVTEKLALRYSERKRARCRALED